MAIDKCPEFLTSTVIRQFVLTALLAHFGAAFSAHTHAQCMHTGSADDGTHPCDQSRLCNTKSGGFSSAAV